MDPASFFIYVKIVMKKFNVTLILPDEKQYTLQVPEDQHILDIALKAGIDLPYSCLQGWCLSCAAKIISGTINQGDSLRYFEEDRKEGFALLCTGKPESDLVLRTHANEEMRNSRQKLKLPHPKGKWGH